MPYWRQRWSPAHHDAMWILIYHVSDVPVSRGRLALASFIMRHVQADRHDANDLSYLFKSHVLSLTASGVTARCVRITPRPGRRRPAVRPSRCPPAPSTRLRVASSTCPPAAPPTPQPRPSQQSSGAKHCSICIILSRLAVSHRTASMAVGATRHRPGISQTPWPHGNSTVASSLRTC